MAGDGGFARLVQDGIAAVLGIAQRNNRKLCPIRKEPLRAKKEKAKLFVNYFEHVILTYYWLALMGQVRQICRTRLLQEKSVCPRPFAVTPNKVSKRCLPAHAYCERVARERAARMGATSCREPRQNSGILKCRAEAVRRHENPRGVLGG